MNTDCAFCIGATHEVCQDYTLSGVNSISLSDGCSGSPLSDFGSRILAVTSMNKMLELDSLHNFDPAELVLSARPSAKLLGLPRECLDATLLCAAKIKDATEAFCYGDGIISMKLKNGNIYVINIEYSDNYPFYINYLYDKTGRYSNWSLYHNKRKITFSVIRENGEVEIITTDDDHKSIRLKYENSEAGLLRVCEDKVFVEIVGLDVESVMIMSDGVQSFYKTIESGTSKRNEKIPYHDVLKELLNFKSYNGKFVQRRMNKFIKTCRNNGWNYADDVSLAAIYLGE